MYNTTGTHLLAVQLWVWSRMCWLAMCRWLAAGQTRSSSHSWCWNSIYPGSASSSSQPSTSGAVWRALTRRIVSARCWRSTDLASTSPSTTRPVREQWRIDACMRSTPNNLPATLASATGTISRPEASSWVLKNPMTPTPMVPVLMQPSCLSRTWSVDSECGWTSYVREHSSGLKSMSGHLWLLHRLSYLTDSVHCHSSHQS